MKKRLFKLFITIVVFSSAFSASAYDFKVDNIYYNIQSEEDSTVLVTDNGTNSYSGNVTIPQTVSYSNETYTVTSINSSAFRLSTNLTNVTIPNTVTFLGSYVFSGCSNLNDITLPENIALLGYGSFLGTGWYNSQPNGVLYLNNYCIGYKKTIKDPDYILRIKEGTRLIASFAFSNYTQTTIYKAIIPNSVLYINMGAFENCSNIYEFTLGDNIIEIGDDAFKNCTGIEEIIIPDKTTTLGFEAFYGCSELKSVVIGSSVSYIDSYCFSNCRNLTSVISKNPTPPVCEDYGAFGRATTTNGVLYVPKGSKQLYQEANYWGAFATIEEYDSSAIEEIKENRNTTTEYYNLQGIKVENPENGIFIKKQGSHTSKVLL